MRIPTTAALGLAVLLAGCASDHHTRAPDPGVALNDVQAARAHATVAQDLEISGDPRGAIENYEKARDLDPRDYQWVAQPLARLYAALGDRVAADAEFRRAWRLDPFDPTVLAEWREN